METKWVCQARVLYIEGHEVTMDLVLLDMSTFDVIVGMDWLAHNHVVLDCYLKKVTFQIPSGLHLSFYGDRRITLIQPIHGLDNRWLRKDCGHCFFFFFNMQGEDKKKIVIDCIPKVCEFAYVFLEELKHFPSYREMDFF